LHNEEIHNFYSSQNIIRHMKSREWGGWGTWHAQKSVQGFGGKSLMERDLGRAKCRWKDGIRMDLEGDRLGSME
jgi:hypothetical protein